jgi:dolichol-phosphate mannosyltransferase
MEISIIIPVYNEEQNLAELYERLYAVLNKLGKTYEIIFVDDGSKDRSFKILRSLNQKNKRIKVIKFSRNFGHHIAISAGLNYSKGDTVVLMDADLQDKPEDIPALFSKLEEGHDVVYALRKSYRASFFDKITSKIFYKILNRLTEMDVTECIGTFRIMRKKVVDNFNRLTEKSRFMTGLIDWLGFDSTTLEVEMGKRVYGKSKYNFYKRLKLAVTGITSFSHFPLHIAGFLGFIIAGISFLFAIYLIFQKIIFGISVPGYTSLMASIFFLSGILLVILGFIGEYIGKIYSEVLNRPLYIIEQLIDNEKETDAGNE